MELTAKPYFVKETKGFDKLKVQIVSSQGYGQDGATYINSYVTPRDMEISGQIMAKTTIQMQNMRDELLNLFIPKKEVTINHYYGGRNRLIKARTKTTPEFKFDEVSTVQKYSVKLEATEPYWSDVQETLVSIANYTGGFRFPLCIRKGVGISFGVKSATLIQDVYNASSINVGIRFVFIANGTVTNPQLFNVNTREFLKVNCEMVAGETITVQTGETKSIIRNLNGVVSDYMGKIDLAGGGYTFLELSPGDNLFRFSADSGEDMLEVKIYYQNKYPGV